MPQQRVTFGGLNTDSPPDRLGDNCLRCLNVLPNSSTSVRPRPGTSELETYRPFQLGCNFIVDVPADNANAIRLIMVNTQESGDPGEEYLTYTCEFIDHFYPALPATAYANASGIDPDFSIYGIYL